MRYASLVLLFVTAGLAADFTVPGVVNATEEPGGHFATELRVTNRDVAPALVRFRFHALDGVSSEEASSEVGPGQTLTWRNLLREAWGLEDVAGAVTLTADRAVQVWAAKYTDEREGVLKVDLPVVEASNRIGPGRTGDLLWLSHSANQNTRIWVAFGSKGGSADLVIFDAAGGEVARKAIGGEARVYRIALADLLAADLPVARAQLHVASGDAAAFGEVTDLSTSDRMGAEAADLSRHGSTALTVHPVLRRGSPAGGVLRSDLRLFNPWAREAAISLTWGGRTQRMTLAAKELREIRDPVNALFETPDGVGALAIATTRPVIALARTAAVPDYDSDAMSGEIHFAEITSEAVSTGEVALAIGLPRATSDVLLSSRPFGRSARADVTLRDADGQAIGALPGGIVLESSARVDSLAEWMNGLTPPPGAAIAVNPFEGALRSAILAIDASGDPSHQSPELVTPAGECLPPAIVSFHASTRTLTSSGPVTLTWSTEGADQVTLSSGPGSVAASGSVELRPTAPTTYTLRAENACGAESEAIAVSVGPPVLRSAAAGGSSGSASGSPGQILVLRFDNLSDPSGIEMLVFRAGNGSERPVEVINYVESGEVYARVPYWFDPNLPSGYRTGQFTVSALLINGARAGSLPFTITPLTYTGDPVAGFRALLDTLAADIREAIAGVREVAPNLASEQTVQAGLQETQLRRMTEEIATRGSSTLLYGAVTAASSTSVSTPITRQHLADLLAFNRNVAEASEFLLGVTNLARERSAAVNREGGGERQASVCIAFREPLIFACKNLKTKDRIAAAAEDAITDFFTAEGAPQGTQQQIESWIRDLLAKTTFGAALKRIQAWLTPVDVMCLIFPIRLENFTVDPKFIKNSKYLSDATPVRIRALLKPETDASHVADWIEAKEAESYRKKLKLKGLTGDLAETFIRSFLNATNHGFDEQIATLIQKAGNPAPSRLLQVGDCDLSSVHPKPVKKNRPRVRLIEIVDDLYRFLGTAPGPETLCIVPKWENFLFRDNVEALRHRANNSNCPYIGSVGSKQGAFRAADVAPPRIVYSDEVDVGERKKQAILTAKDALAGIRVQSTAYRTIHEINVTDGSPVRVSASSGLSSANGTVRKTGPARWEADLNATALAVPNSTRGVTSYTGTINFKVLFENPENRDNTQRFRMTASGQGGQNCRFTLHLAAGTQLTGGTGFGPASYSLDRRGETFGYFEANVWNSVNTAGESANCSARLTAELLDK
ncbi:MAG: hypothetical protein ACKV22_20455 [Bryobacteraceae bacterium]